MNEKQIFQTDSSVRWNVYRVTLTLLIAGFLFSAAIFFYSVCGRSYPSLPKLKAYHEAEDKELLNSATYKDFRLTKRALLRLQHDRKKLQKTGNSASTINAGFYVNWDAESFYSLKSHIDKMNMILPEWFFVGKGDTVETDVDKKALNFLHRQQKPVIVMVSNYFQEQWNASNVHRLISSPAKRSLFINSLLSNLKKNNFQGVNIDFEDLQEKSDENLIMFQRELYQSLHSKGYLVTQDIAPFNEDYNLRELQKYNDYLFVMAYDQHFAGSKPGDISNQHWVESVIDDICTKVPSEKIVVALAAYGYDWQKGRQGQDISYQEAVGAARESGGKISFDPQSANLHFSYYDDNNKLHDVYFTDAVTNFNIIKQAQDWGTAGTAIWRLGSEDPRLWSFFGKKADIKPATAAQIQNSFASIPANRDVYYSGDGEILDIVGSPAKGSTLVSYNTSSNRITSERYIRLPDSYLVKRYGATDKKMVLTFDDGPDEEYTPEILDILAKEKVPASFFVVGENAEESIPIVRELNSRGYEIGNHTFTHPNIAEVGPERVGLELNATRKLIESITGRSTVLFRAPYNADSEPHSFQEIEPVVVSRKENYITVGESIDPEDWQIGVTADQIFKRVVQQQKLGHIILLHDAGGDRSATVEALPKIIHYFKSRGYKFTTVADLLGKSRNDLMPRVTSQSASILSHLNIAFLEGVFIGSHALYYIFTAAIILAIGRMIVILYLALRNKKKSRGFPVSTAKPPVSIIVPAYNEEVTAVKTIKSLLELSYPRFEIIFVNDGSKDQTLNVVTAAYSSNEGVRILDKPNGGKASALNYGIRHACSDYVICIDADTQLAKDAIEKLMECFTDQVAAVAGTVVVGNESNYLTMWQSIEYTTSQNMDRRAFDLLNSISVVPGAIGAFRKSAIEKAGGFTSDTLAEDCDLTMRLLKEGFIVRNCDSAFAYTEAPETLSMFMKQRFRWSFGIMQSFWKNRDALFNSRFGNFGLIAMPNILLFQIILPLFAPLTDILMVTSIVAGNGLKVLLFYTAFIFFDIIVAAVAFTISGQPYRKLFHLLPQKLIYRQLMYFILYKSIRKAIKGEFGHWGVLKRSGNVVVQQGNP